MTARALVRGDRLPSTREMATEPEGIQHGYSTRDFCDHLRSAAVGRKLRVVVIAATYDQTEGLVNELRHYYGLDVTGVLAGVLNRGAPLPNVIKRAHLLVATEAHQQAGELARRTGKAFVLADVRAELFGEWETLLHRQVFVIATDPRFVDMLRARLATVSGGTKVDILIAGRDDLSVIPPRSPTYVTQAQVVRNNLSD